ncbi:hypothetical protein C8R43DRAFT_1128038 [Mycena crocata]|nr:hypothetical protein C8R43DRAFT_1128038 [Mycena crocata]
MFATMLQLKTPRPLPVPDMARRLGLSDAAGWCAGNECCTLVDVFREMAKRGAIDEQIKEWPGQSIVRNGDDEEESDYDCSDSE